MILMVNLTFSSKQKFPYKNVSTFNQILKSSRYIHKYEFNTFIVKIFQEAQTSRSPDFKKPRLQEIEFSTKSIIKTDLYLKAL